MWAIYSQVHGGDLVHSIVANALGICLEITQFILFFIFRNGNEEDNVSVGEKPEEEKFNVEIQKENEPEYLHEFV